MVYVLLSKKWKDYKQKSMKELTWTCFENLVWNVKSQGSGNTMGRNNKKYKVYALKEICYVY